MSFMLSASAATAEQIVDLAESNFQPEVRVLAALNIVEGYEDGTFKPAQNVTRAELATILSRVRVGGDKEMINTYNYGHMTYTDVLNAGYVWAAPAIQYATDNGMVVGDGNNTFRPGDTVTVVEGLKMLLTALDYNAEIEGLQNVGAAWKANTLSLAREVGLLDRYYGDTNKNMTRDDMALLIFNFLNSEVVKGYYENNVANVDTIMYFGGTALEIYFEKQVVYGAIMANGAANVLVEPVTTNNVTDYQLLDADETLMFLYDNDEGVTMVDILDARNGNAPAVLENQVTRGFDINDVIASYFVEFANLSTDLGDIGEPVFVITDLEPTKGEWIALGGMAFSTGTNNAGVETWDAVSAQTLGALTDDEETVYANNYDGLTATTAWGWVPNTNGNFLKTVDWDDDGVLDIVLHEDWGMIALPGTNKRGEVVIPGTTENISATTGANNNLWDTDWVSSVIPALNTIAAGSPTAGMVNFHFADGLYYTVAAETLSKLDLADGKDAVNFKNGYVTLSDGNQYYQSAVVPFPGFGQLIDIMNCADDPYAVQTYTWYLDNGGYIRIYGADRTVYDGLYLLTDATSVKSGRNVYDKTVDTYKQSNEMVEFSTSGVTSDPFVYIEDANLPYGDALSAKAIPGAITNLAAGIAADTSLTLGLVSVFGNSIVELRGDIDENIYSTRDDHQKLGDWNLNNTDTDADTVYTTTATDYYYVVLDTDRDGKVFVKSVEYFDGYLNVKDFDFDSCTAAYAAASLEKDNDDDKYYYATTVVFETFESAINVSTPYFAYEQVSAHKDHKGGIYNAIDPTGVNTTYDVTTVVAENMTPAQTYGALGFYTHDLNNGFAYQIVEDWADFNIYAAEIAIAKTGKVDYYVLNDIRGDEIRLAETTPVYMVLNELNNENIDMPYWTVVEYDDDLDKGDKIIYVTNDLGAIQYVLVVESDTYDLGWNDGEHWLVEDEYGWSTRAIALWNKILGNETEYGPEVLIEKFIAAVAAMTDAQVANATHTETPADPVPFTPAQLSALLDAEMEAWMALDSKTDALDNITTGSELDNANKDFWQDVNGKSGATDHGEHATEWTDFRAELAEANVAWDVWALDTYVDGTIQEAYAALSETQKDFLAYNPWNMSEWLIGAYTEISDEDIAVAQELIDAVVAYDEAKTHNDIDQYEDRVAAAYAEFVKLCEEKSYTWETETPADDDETTIYEALIAAENLISEGTNKLQAEMIDTLTTYYTSGGWDAAYAAYQAWAEEEVDLADYVVATDDGNANTVENAKDQIALAIAKLAENDHVTNWVIEWGDDAITVDVSDTAKSDAVKMAADWADKCEDGAWALYGTYTITFMVGGASTSSTIVLEA